MEAFIWGPAFETGLKEVDDQHQTLVELINRLGSELTVNNMRSERSDSIIRELGQYAQQHFEDEEEMMSRLKLDRRHIDIHLIEHSTFLDDVVAMSEQFSENRPGTGRSLLEFLIHWLAYHILGSDQNMARQVRDIEKGIPPADAYLKEERMAAESTAPLLAALNGLFQQVSSRNRELSKLNSTLEAKVEERTRELLKANEDLEILALTDVLTNLPNRRHAMRQLQALWKECHNNNKPLACMMIDADNFKAINDTHGHDAGDIVLKRLARELHHSVRSDDVVCRLGGDEFLIICPATPLDGAMHVAELVRERVADLKVKAGSGIWLGSISVGVAENTADMKSVDDLLKAADDGVYKSKRDGRNCVRTRQTIT